MPLLLSRFKSPPPDRALGVRASLLLLVTILAIPFVLYAAWGLAKGFERDHAHARRITEDTAQLAAARLDASIRKDEHLSGAAFVATDLEDLPGVVDLHRSLPAGAVITVVDMRGVVLARSLDAGHWVGRQMLPDLVRLRQQREAGLGVMDDVKSFDGRVRMIAFAALRNTPWLVFVGVPVDAALAPAWRRLWESVLLLVPMFGVTLAAAAWVARRLTVPLQRLSFAAEAVGRGEQQHIANDEGPREIRSLAGSLMRMSVDLQNRTDAHRESERLLRDLTDHLPALISLIDTHEKITFANHAYFEWLGLPPEQVIGHSVRTLYGEAVHESVHPYFDTAFGGQRVVYERTMDTLKGPRQVQVTLLPRQEGRGVCGVYAMILDITEQRSAQAQLALSEERLSLAMEGSEQALFDWNIPQRTLYQSAHASILRGGAAVDMTHEPEALLQWVHPDDVNPLQTALAATLHGQTPAFRFEHRVSTLDGRWLWVLSRGRVVERDEAGRALRLAGTHVDVSDRHALEERLRRLADVDALTGLPNRRLFMDRLESALARARRHGRPLALMFLDIDHFKGVNDTFGHESGDQVLRSVAQRLRSSVRSSDTVARLAGDEFTVIMEDFDTHRVVDKVARGLVAAVRHVANLGDNRTWRVSTSLGVAIVEGHTLVANPQMVGEHVLKKADVALYQAKRLGRDRYCVFDNAAEITDMALPTPA